MKGKEGTTVNQNNIKFSVHKHKNVWTVKAAGKTFQHVIVSGTGEQEGWFYVRRGPNGQQWPGKYLTRHYAARDILRKARMWKDEGNYQDNF